MPARRCPPPAPARAQALRVIRHETRPAQGRRHFVATWPSATARSRSTVADHSCAAGSGARVPAQVIADHRDDRRLLAPPCPAPSGENPPCHPHQDQHRRPGRAILAAMALRPAPMAPDMPLMMRTGALHRLRPLPELAAIADHHGIRRGRQKRLHRLAQGARLAPRPPTRQAPACRDNVASSTRARHAARCRRLRPPQGGQGRDGHRPAPPAPTARPANAARVPASRHPDRSPRPAPANAAARQNPR